MVIISAKYLKSISTSDSKKIMDKIKSEMSTDPDNSLKLYDVFIQKLKEDEQYFLNKEYNKISDTALFAPRRATKANSSENPVRLAYHGAKKYFLDTGRVKEQLNANIHWQRLVAKLSKTYVEERIKESVLKQEFKTNRVLEHQRGNWCCLRKREITKSVGKPTAMPVDVAPKEELVEFFTHLANDKTIEFKQFKRGTIFPDGRMDLCKQVVGPLWIGNLMDSLKTNTQIEHFLLGNNITNLEGGKAIGKFLAEPHSCKIKTWYLAGSDFNSEAIKYICDGLKHDVDCNALWLKRNPIYAEGVMHIAELLKVNKTIKILDLHNCGVGLKQSAYDALNPYENHMTTKGIEVLFDALKENKTLRHLYLDANAIDEKSIPFIVNYFEYKTLIKEKGLTSLWIDMNKLGDDGIVMLCKSLKDYPFLKRLCLGSTMMSEVGMKAVSENLKNHKSLNVLDLSLYKSTADMGMIPNNISNNGAQYICELIEGQNCIKYLNIGMNNIDSEHIEKIAESLEKNKNILYFHYKQYGQEIKQEVVMQIDKILEQNRKLYTETTGIVTSDEHMRCMKHSNKVKNIDSIYRNNMK
jgi:Ran GTPase-activating protein (RanGAP) involved in mRNA processing and transport